MKSVTYTGGCSTIQEFGQKFTLLRRSVTLSDEDAKVFEGHPNYRVIDVPDLTVNATVGGQEGSGNGQNGENEENNNGQGENNDEQTGDDAEALKKKLKRLTAEQLQQMCTDRGLDTTGTKDELVERIVNA
jgi:hypothetical protein